MQGVRYPRCSCLPICRVVRQFDERLGKRVQLTAHVDRNTDQALEEMDCVGAAEQQHLSPDHPTAVAVPASGRAAYAFQPCPPALIWDFDVGRQNSRNPITHV